MFYCVYKLKLKIFFPALKRDKNICHYKIIITCSTFHRCSQNQKAPKQNVQTRQISLSKISKNR